MVAVFYRQSMYVNIHTDRYIKTSDKPIYIHIYFTYIHRKKPGGEHPAGFHSESSKSVPPPPPPRTRIDSRSHRGAGGHDRGRMLWSSRNVPIALVVLLLLTLARHNVGVLGRQAQQDDDDNDNDVHPPPRPTNHEATTVLDSQHIQQKVPDRTVMAPFDTDIREDCRRLLEHCQSAMFPHIYLQCPALCTKYLTQEGSKGTVTKHTEETLWEGTFRTLSGQRIHAERFEGSVMVIALLPLLPGMAKYYYEMMEVLHKKFFPKVECIILPIDVGEGIHLSPRPSSPVVILEEESALLSHPWVRHLHSVIPRSGAASRKESSSTPDNISSSDKEPSELQQVELPTDRLTMYLVSADGYFVERMTVPTLAVLQQQIAIYLQTMDYHADL